MDISETGKKFQSPVILSVKSHRISGCNTCSNRRSIMIIIVSFLYSVIVKVESCIKEMSSSASTVLYDSCFKNSFASLQFGHVFVVNKYNVSCGCSDVSGASS